MWGATQSPTRCGLQLDVASQLDVARTREIRDVKKVHIDINHVYITFTSQLTSRCPHQVHIKFAHERERDVT